MTQSIVLTIIGPDRTGIVDSISTLATTHGASWQESHLARLAGQFAGIVHLICPNSSADALRNALSHLQREGLEIFLVRANSTNEPQSETYTLDVLGHDRPGILSEVTQIVKNHRANIQEIETNLESAPEAGHLLFHAVLKITTCKDNPINNLTQGLEALSPELQVSLS